MTVPETRRVDLGSTVPTAYRALADLSEKVLEATTAAGLDPLLVELVKIRVSQLNGCAFCLRMHTRDAVAQGETADRLAVLPAWRESRYFSPAERHALALAERTTLAPGSEQLDEASVLDAGQTAAVHWLAVVMNSWNRVALASHYRVAPEATSG